MKWKSLELSIKVDREYLGISTVLKLTAIRIGGTLVSFNIGLLALAIGLYATFSYILIPSFFVWLGYNLIGLGINILYKILLKDSIKPYQEKLNSDIYAYSKEITEAIQKNTEEKSL